MRTAGAIEMTCRCVSVEHERRCIFAWVVEERGRLYDGLYDHRASRRVAGATAPPLRVKLLNPSYAGDDPLGRRFAQLEID